MTEGFNLREKAYDALEAARVALFVAAIIGFAWFALAFAIISYGRVA